MIALFCYLYFALLIRYMVQKGVFDQNHYHFDFLIILYVLRNETYDIFIAYKFLSNAYGRLYCYTLRFSRKILNSVDDKTQ